MTSYCAQNFVAKTFFGKTETALYAFLGKSVLKT